MGSKPDTLSNGQTPLMIACLRNHSHIIDLLIEYQADVTLMNEEEMAALDFAILYGNYAVALMFLTRFEMRIGYSVEEYKTIAIKKKSYYVNYAIMLDCLNKKFDEQSIPNLYERPPSNEST
jgi:ankyrin repeat protein